MKMFTKYVATILLIMNLLVLVDGSTILGAEEYNPVTDTLTSTIESIPTVPPTEAPTEQPTTVPTVAPTEPLLTEWEVSIKCASQYKTGINVKNMFFVTGVTVEELNMLLEGTRLEGAGKYFKQLEDDYGVNAILAISVGRLESQLGDSDIAREYNNAFGFRGDNGWLHFKSLEDSVIYFGKLMNHERYLGKSLSEIGKIYCPNDVWSDKVSSVVDRHVKMIEAFREEQ